MSYLLRVKLPDVPGSLGRLASAIGAAGANIDAIEIVGRDSSAGLAIDDVFINPDAEVMPDSIVSACNSLGGVRVLWISRYAAGGNLFLDLEAVESMTQDPAKAVDRLVIEAATTGSERRAVQAFALHPLVDSVTVARELLAGYRARIPLVDKVFRR